MGIVKMGPPDDLVLLLKSLSGIDAFVETGTYLGDTTAWAASIFAEVHTVELSESFFKKACARFESQKNLTVHLGNSLEILPNILSMLKTPAFFWLDAHWSGGATAGEGFPVPILSEISCIRAHSSEHIILIDDARLFLSPPPRPHSDWEYPAVSELFSCLSRKASYEFLFDDVIVSVPASFRETVVSYCQDEYEEKASRPDLLTYREILKHLVRRFRYACTRR